MGVNTRTAIVTLPTDQQILITREFEAPPAKVFRVWSTPELVQRWWGGGHGTVSSVEIDFRVGGRWRYVMAGPDGSELAFHGSYREIVEDFKIVYRSGSGGDAEEDDEGAVDAHHLFVGEPARAFAQLCAANGHDLVDHDSAVVAEPAEFIGIDRHAEQW